MNNTNLLRHPRLYFGINYSLSLGKTLLAMWKKEFQDRFPPAFHARKLSPTMPENEDPIQYVYPIWWMQKVAASGEVLNILWDNMEANDNKEVIKTYTLGIAAKWLWPASLAQQIDSFEGRSAMRTAGTFSKIETEYWAVEDQKELYKGKKRKGLQLVTD